MIDMKRTIEEINDTLVYRDKPQNVNDFYVYTHKSDTPDWSRRNCNDPDDVEFSGGDTYDDTYEYAMKGWPKGLGMVEDADEMIKSMGIESPAFQRDVYGDFIDIGSYCTGQPDCFFREIHTQDTHAQGKVKRIIVGNSFNSGVRSEYVRNRGAAIMTLIDGLEMAGFRTEVTIATLSEALSSQKYKGTSYGSDKIMHLVETPVKKSDEPLNRERLAFGLMHAGYFRRFTFMLRETLSESAQRAFSVSEWGGYGCTRNVGENMDIMSESEYDIVFDNKNWSRFSNKEDSMKVVKSLLTKHGVELQS